MSWCITLVYGIDLPLWNTFPQEHMKYMCDSFFVQCRQLWSIICLPVFPEKHHKKFMHKRQRRYTVLHNSIYDVVKTFRPSDAYMSQ